MKSRLAPQQLVLLFSPLFHLQLQVTVNMIKTSHIGLRCCFLLDNPFEHVFCVSAPFSLSLSVCICDCYVAWHAVCQAAGKQVHPTHLIAPCRSQPWLMPDRVQRTRRVQTHKKVVPYKSYISMQDCILSLVSDIWLTDRLFTFSAFSSLISSRTARKDSRKGLRSFLMARVKPASGLWMRKKIIATFWEERLAAPGPVEEQ